MLTRRGFFGRVGGALAAAVVAPRALFAREQPITLGSLTTAGSYSYRVTYITADGETVPAVQPPTDAIGWRLYVSDGRGNYRMIDGGRT